MAHKATLLLMPHALSVKNSLTKTALLRRMPFAMLGLMFWLALYVGAYKGIVFLRSIELLGDMMSARLLSTFFFGLVGFLFVSNVITAISTFYLSKDLPYLRSLPLMDGEILSAKTVHSVITSSWMAFSFVPPVLIAFGTAYDAPLSYYPAVFISLLLLALITAGAGISAAHITTRFVPARTLRSVFLFAGLFLFLAAYFAVRNKVPASFDNPLELLQSVTFDANFPLAPSYWITNMSLSMLRGHDPDMLFAALLLSNAIFLTMVSLTVGERLYRRNLERLIPADKSHRTGNALKVFYPGRGLAFPYKDIKLFYRDTAQWSQILIILSLVFVYVYNFKALPVKSFSETAPFIKDILLLLNILLCGMVISAVSARFLYSSVSLEGQAFWLIKAAPTHMGKFLYRKFLYGFIPVCSLTMAAFTLTNLLIDIHGTALYLSLATTFVLSVSIGGLATGLGAVWPKFKYENIASIPVSFGGLTFMLLSFALVSATTLIEALPFYLKYRDGEFPTGVAVSCALAGLIVNALAFYLPMRAGILKLRNIEL